MDGHLVDDVSLFICEVVSVHLRNRLLLTNRENLTRRGRWNELGRHVREPATVGLVVQHQVGAAVGACVVLKEQVFTRGHESLRGVEVKCPWLDILQLT